MVDHGAHEPRDGVGAEREGGDRAKVPLICRRAGVRLPIKSARSRGSRNWSGGNSEFATQLEHDPEKWRPVFGKRSCSNKDVERDGDSKKSHPALARISGRTTMAEL